MTRVRPHVAQRVANISPMEALRLDSRRGDAARPWNAASRCRTSGGRRTTSASIRLSGLASSETARRWRSTAVRATQPPRPNRSATTSPGPVCASIRVLTRPAGGGGASRSKTGRAAPGWASWGPRPVIGQMLADGRQAYRRPRFSADDALRQVVGATVVRARGGSGVRPLRLVELVGLVLERLVGRGLRRQDAVEVLDLVVLLVVFEVVLEVHLL